MKTIRNSVFETNSSSSHCVALMSDAEYIDFTKNDGLFNFFTSEPATWEDFYRQFKRDCNEEGVKENEIPTLLEFKAGVAEFEDYNEDPFESSEANNALWKTMRYGGITSNGGIGEISHTERELGGQKVHAVSWYVPE
jgi:hypothetical protein